MTKQAVYTVQKNQKIARDVYLMRLAGPTGAITAPGQFINIKLAGFYLRRPISVCSWDAAGIDIIYKILGRGTAHMATLPPGSRLDVLVGLGNGFNTAAARGKAVALAGGGVGIPPLYGLAQKLVAEGTVPHVALGCAGAADVFYQEEFEALGCVVAVATEDGSAGSCGFVTHLLQNMQYQYYFTCGPAAMLRAVYALGKEKGAAGQLSFEERMGCGFGACMGCSCHTLVGPKRVCVDGPVFVSGEVCFDA